jgi:hypothetical protein
MNDHAAGHERINVQLDDLVDGSLSEDARRAVETHLEACAVCRADLAARRALLNHAAALPRRIEPERDLWPDVRSRLEGREESERARRWGRPRSVPIPALAAAAVVLLVAGAAALTLWLAGSGGPAGASRTAARAVPGAGPDAVTLVADWRALEGEYEGAANELQQTLDEIGDQLLPETRRIIEQNLRVINEAIVESRAALERDPANRELELVLRSAWSSKVELLQYVTRL